MRNFLTSTGDMGGRIVSVTSDSDITGEHHLVTFVNGYAASVIRGPFTYGGPSGLWEIAVIGPDGAIDYTTPITDDVRGYLSSEEAGEVMMQIASL